MQPPTITTQIPQSLENGAGSIKVVSGSGFRYLVPFPYKLHKMLEETEQKGDAYTSIVSWLPDGKHFRVHDSRAFMTHVVPQFFKQKSYKSFQRQLHIYGFKRILKGDMQGAFYHPKFIKGNRGLTHEIDRIKAPVARKNGRLSMEKGEKTRESRVTESRRISSDTMEWLVSSGMMFSDLEPSYVPDQGVPKFDATQSTEQFSLALLSQADQISSLFAPLIKSESLSKSSSASSLPREERVRLSPCPNHPQSSISAANDYSDKHYGRSLPKNNLFMESSFSIIGPPPGSQEAIFASNTTDNPSMMCQAL